MVYPVKPWSDTRISVSFLDSSYNDFRKMAGLPPAEHPGIDINIGSPGNWDFGYPVRSIYWGEVVSASKHRVWGNVVLIWHPTLNVWTQYAHLAHMSVRQGDVVEEGEDIGSIGRGDPAKPFVAHLHFEVRKCDLEPDFWPGMNMEKIIECYIDPMHVFDKFGAGDKPRRCR